MNTVNRNTLLGSSQNSIFSSVNPSNGQIIWQGSCADKKQVYDAVAMAKSAFKQWSKAHLDERIDVVIRFSEELKKHAKEMAQIICSETGKTLWESTGEVTAMIAKIAISITAYHERTSTTEQSLPDAKSFTRYKPHGVVAIFGPYNFPGHLPNGHVVPALIAGNTIVFKPSELTPKTAEFMGGLWHKSGLPKGVLNIVQGKSKTGALLASHADINGLFFTGSSKTGHLLHQQFAAKPEKILALEMGGNNPLIVKGVQDVDAAVHDIVQSSFVTSGQRCTCARRLFIENSSNGEAILNKLIEVTHNIIVGDPQSENQPYIGSMISEQAALQMLDAQQKLKSLGGKILVKLKHLLPGTGFVSPGIIDVSHATDLPDEEYFGPLLKVYRYTDLRDAIEEANNTSFGLSAGILADDPKDYEVFFSNILAGIINWNKPTTGASSASPFGGIGASGNHRPSAYFAADYCSYPIASIETTKVCLPKTLSPGLHI